MPISVGVGVLTRVACMVTVHLLLTFYADRRFTKPTALAFLISFSLRLFVSLVLRPWNLSAGLHALVVGRCFLIGVGGFWILSAIDTLPRSIASSAHDAWRFIARVDEFDPALPVRSLCP